jgi:L-threonylcarbamoyladenylate synthase
VRCRRFADHEDVALAAEAVASVIDSGGVVLLPTETLYGLGTSPFSAEGVERIRVMKGRPEGGPLPVLCAGWVQVEELVSVSDRWKPRLRKEWPGPLTAVLPCRQELPVAAEGSIGVRIPDHELLRQLLGRIGPLTGTSANRHGAPPCSDVASAVQSLVEAPDLVLDGGPTPGGIASTVVRLAGHQAVVLRRGPVRWV